MIREPIALLTFMFLVVACARLVEARVRFVQRITSAVLCTLLGIMLSNLGVIPHTSTIHEAVYEFAVPYTIVLVVLSSRLSDLKRAGPSLVIAFLVASVGSLAGGVIAGHFFTPWVGPETWKVSGMFVAAFVGGGMNFAAVGRGLDCSPGVFAAAAMADNLTTVPWMLTLMFLSGALVPWFRGRAVAVSALKAIVPSRGAAEMPAHSPAPARQEPDPRLAWGSTSVDVTDLALLAGLPLAVLWAAKQLTPLIPGFPSVLWVTTIALVIAQVPAVHRLRGAAAMSYFSLHLFFIVIGASSILREVIVAGPAIVVFMVAILAIHLVIIFGGGWLLRINLPKIAVGSMASVGGPGSTLALAMAMKWNDLVTPGVIMGIFGWAVGNYFGFACAYLVRLWQ
ncbi:MAG: DUF819 family protein [Acidobacteria bacterium]|nr:DUF819 family protein [Acidobacteriota bacterium]